MSTHLFVLCPPYSGSTLLWKLIGTSTAVSTLPDEGQFLPEVKKIMRAGPWQRDLELPWADIRRAWERYWDQDKPVLLEKSPPNLIRTDAIREHFQPVEFVIMVRNPYAQAEGLMRRNGWTAERSARFALMCLREQRRNRDTIDATVTLTYEGLVADPAAACTALTRFLPALGELDHTASFEVHSVDGTVNRPITNLNAKKIAALSAEQRATMRSVFATEPATLDAWDYPLDAGDSAPT